MISDFSLLLLRLNFLSLLFKKKKVSLFEIPKETVIYFEYKKSEEEY